MTETVKGDPATWPSSRSKRLHSGQHRDELALSCDITSWTELVARAAMLFPYDDEFQRWQDI